VKILILEEAQHHFEVKDTWWRENRDEKDLFTDEFDQALRRIAEFPMNGQQYRMARGKLILRVLMNRTLCHVYYWYGPEVDTVEIHAIWGAARRRGPRL
jgi:plasmid stabilization system protein ParE